MKIIRYLSTLLVLLLFSPVIESEKANAQVIEIGKLQYLGVAWGPFRADITADRHSRHAIIYPESLVGSLQQGTSISSFEFYRWVMAGWHADSLVGNVDLKIYVKNRDTAFFAGPVDWAQEIQNATLVYDGDPKVHTGAGSGLKEFPFIQDHFWDTTNGNHLQIMLEYSQTTGQPENVGWLINDDDPAGGIPEYESFQHYYDLSIGSHSNILSTENIFRPYIIINALLDNDINTREAYATGHFPLDYLDADTIKAALRNDGADTQYNFMVYVEVDGANTFTDSQVVSSLIPGESIVVDFAPFHPTNTGINNIKVYTNADELPGNDTAYYEQNVTRNKVGHPGTEGMDLDWSFTGTGTFINKYYVSGTGTVASVEAFIAPNTDNIAGVNYGVVYDGQGNKVARSDDLTITAAELGTYVTFLINDPPTFTDTFYYVGLNQVGGHGRPMGAVNESPLRSNAYFTQGGAPTAGGAITPNANDLRFMIHAQYGIEDVGIASLTSPTSSMCGEELTHIEAIIENFGNLTSGNFDVTAEITGTSVSDTTITVTFTDSINAGQTDNISIGYIDTRMGGTFNYKIYTSLAGDDDNSNDTLTGSIQINMSPEPPVVENDTLCGGGVFELVAESDASLIHWYFTPTSTNKIHTGDTLITGNISQTFQYYAEADESGCISGRTLVFAVVLPPPSIELAEGADFEGGFNQGSVTDPDATCSESTLTYDIEPQGNLQNDDYGNIWEITSYSLENQSGVSASDFTFQAPSTGVNGMFSFSPSSSEANMTFTLQAYTENLETGCIDSLTRIIQVNPAIEANFQINDACAGEEIALQNMSDTSYSVEWNFSDNYVSGDFEPVRSITDAGNYDVTLTVTNQEGCSSEETESFTVYDVPESDFTVEDVCIGSTATLQGSSTVSDGQNLDFSWDVEHYGNFNGETATFNADVEGSFNVMLVTTSDGGCADTIEKSFTVNPTPEVDFAVSNGCVDENINVLNQTQGDIDSYVWRLNGDSVSNATTPTGISMSDGGVHSLSLTATSSAGCSDDLEKEFVASRAEADFEFDVDENEVFFNAINLNMDNYEWNFGDGNTGDGASTSHIYPEEGNSYAVTLYVEDSLGCNATSVDSVTISGTFLIRNVSPQFSVDLYPNPTAGNFTIDLYARSNAAVYISIFDMSGRNIMNESFENIVSGNNKLDFDIRSAEPVDGLYLVRIIQGDQIYYSKLQLMN